MSNEDLKKVINRMLSMSAKKQNDFISLLDIKEKALIAKYLIDHGASFNMQDDPDEDGSKEVYIFIPYE